MGRAVWIILQGNHLSRNTMFISFEIYDPVFSLRAAPPVPDAYPPLIVPAGILLQGHYERFLGLFLGKPTEILSAHIPSAR